MANAAPTTPPTRRASEPLTEVIRARVTHSMAERLAAKCAELEIIESDAVRVAAAAWLDGPLGDPAVVALLREAWEAGEGTVTGWRDGRTFEAWLDEVRGR